MTLLIIYLILAIGISFLCSILEAVILSVTPAFVQVSADQDKPGASLLKSLKENIDRPLSAILTLNTIAHTVGAAGVGAQAVAVFGEAYFGLISAVLTILILIFSEVIPKTIGARYWKQLAFPAARVIRFLVYLLYPLVIISEAFTRLLVRRKKASAITREEIKVLTRLGSKEGVIKQSEESLINNILKMRTIKVREIMTPRTVVKAVSEEMSDTDFIQDKEIMHFSRIPVYKDNIEECTGYVLKNDVLLELIKGSEKERKVGRLKRNLVIAPESQVIFKLFEELLRKKEHISIVVDEYGGFEGIVTLEDIIETILGMEIQDETDGVKDMQELAMEKWKIRAKRMNLDLESED